MSRAPLMGYNHNLRYNRRIYHIQTEASDHAAKVFTHLFSDGTVISSAAIDIREQLTLSDAAKKVKRLMQQQHKMLMRQLLSGELDSQITALLGRLEPEPEHRKIKTYQHLLSYHGRKYSIETRFYANVVTDVFWEEIFISSEQTDCRALAPPGSEALELLAQQQHKKTLKQLRDGDLDQKIIQLLGALAPPQPRLMPTETSGLHVLIAAAKEYADEQRHRPKPLDCYHHRVQYKGRVYDLRTVICSGASTYSQTELYYNDTLLTCRRQPGSKDPCALREQGQQIHKKVLIELRNGLMDETIELMEELECLRGDDG